SLEAGVLYRMIFHLHGETFVALLRRNPFGHSPRFEHVIYFQTQIVMQTPRSMLLDDKHRPSPLPADGITGRLSRAGEVSLGFVTRQTHGNLRFTIYDLRFTHPRFCFFCILHSTFCITVLTLLSFDGIWPREHAAYFFVRMVWPLRSSS